MTDLGDTLASDVAQEIVRALVAGLVEVAKKVPTMWRRSGRRKQDMIRVEIRESAGALQAAGADLAAAQVRQAGVWEGRLRDLLAETPEAAEELQSLRDEIRRILQQVPYVVQNVTASAGGMAQGAIFGNVINYGDTSRSGDPVPRPQSDPNLLRAREMGSGE